MRRLISHGLRNTLFCQTSDLLSWSRHIKRSACRRRNSRAVKQSPPPFGVDRLPFRLLEHSIPKFRPWRPAARQIVESLESEALTNTTSLEVTFAEHVELPLTDVERIVEMVFLRGLHAEHGVSSRYGINNTLRVPGVSEGS
jgi:hypothetical protein